MKIPRHIYYLYFDYMWYTEAGLTVEQPLSKLFNYFMLLFCNNTISRQHI